MDNKKSEFLLKFLETLVAQSPNNVPQPLPLIEEKAQNRLNADDLISWKLILKEWEKVSDEGKKTISRLLILNSHNVIEVSHSLKDVFKETADTAKYVAEHPEYQLSNDEVETRRVIDEFFNKLESDEH